MKVTALNSAAFLIWLSMVSDSCWKERRLPWREPSENLVRFSCTITISKNSKKKRMAHHLKIKYHSHMVCYSILAFILILKSSSTERVSKLTNVFWKLDQKNSKLCCIRVLMKAYSTIPTKWKKFALRQTCKKRPATKWCVGKALKYKKKNEIN